MERNELIDVWKNFDRLINIRCEDNTDGKVFLTAEILLKKKLKDIKTQKQGSGLRYNSSRMC